MLEKRFSIVSLLLTLMFVLTAVPPTMVSAAEDSPIYTINFDVNGGDLISYGGLSEKGRYF